MINIDNLCTKKILLVGFAREGISSYKYLRKHNPNQTLGIFDQKNLPDLEKEAQTVIKKDTDLKLFLEQQDFSLLEKIAKDFDLIIKSAGIPNKNIADNLQGKVVTQTSVFLDNFKGKIIGITGTKGKSTTSSLIFKIIKDSGKKVVLLGNIGAPSLDFLDEASRETIGVMEISSHQLSTLKKSPNIAVLLNIYPEHLDYYSNISEYISAKANITKFQNQDDYLIYNHDDAIVAQLAKNSSAAKIPLNKKESKALRWLTNLIGDHNKLNALASIKVAKILGIPVANIQRSIRSFKTLPHRLELVGIYKDITFYNDSLSTIPEAAVCALNGFGTKVDSLIAGGFDRGINFKILAKAILKSHIRNLILFPTTGEKIWLEIVNLFPTAGQKYKVFFTEKMKDAVKFCFENTRRNKICLLSNGSPSFGIFKDYADRGNQFKKWVRELGK